MWYTKSNPAPKYQYDAFGNQRTDDATDPNPFRYCGEYYDKELGEVYLRARQYDPRTGRFTSEDPVKNGANWYAYGKNNPVRYVDPTGLKSYETYVNGKWVPVPERYLGDFKQWRIVENKGTYNYKKGQGGKYTPTKSGNPTAPSGGPTLLPPPKFSYGNLNSFGSNANIFGGSQNRQWNYTSFSNKGFQSPNWSWGEMDRVPLKFDLFRRSIYIHFNALNNLNGTSGFSGTQLLNTGFGLIEEGGDWQYGELILSGPSAAARVEGSTQYAGVNASAGLITLEGNLDVGQIFGGDKDSLVIGGDVTFIGVDTGSEFTYEQVDGRTRITFGINSIIIPVNVYIQF